MEIVNRFLELVSKLLHFLHLVRVESVVSPIASGVGLSPMSVKVSGIELIVGPVEEFFEYDFFEHLLESDSIILDIGSVKVPNDINEFIGSEETVSVIIVEPEELLALGLVELTEDAESLEDEL